MNNFHMTLFFTINHLTTGRLTSFKKDYSIFLMGVGVVGQFAVGGYLYFRTKLRERILNFPTIFMDGDQMLIKFVTFVKFIIDLQYSFMDMPQGI